MGPAYSLQRIVRAFQRAFGYAAMDLGTITAEKERLMYPSIDRRKTTNEQNCKPDQEQTHGFLVVTFQH